MASSSFVFFLADANQLQAHCHLLYQVIYIDKGAPALGKQTYLTKETARQRGVGALILGFSTELLCQSVSCDNTVKPNSTPKQGMCGIVRPDWTLRPLSCSLGCSETVLVVWQYTSPCCYPLCEDNDAWCVVSNWIFSALLWHSCIFLIIIYVNWNLGTTCF